MVSTEPHACMPVRCQTVRLTTSIPMHACMHACMHMCMHACMKLVMQHGTVMAHTSILGMHACCHDMHALLALTLCLTCRQYAEVLLAMGRTEQALSLFGKTLMLRKSTLGARHLIVYDTQVSGLFAIACMTSAAALLALTSHARVCLIPRQFPFRMRGWSRLRSRLYLECLVRGVCCPRCRARGTPVALACRVT